MKDENYKESFSKTGVTIFEFYLTNFCGTTSDIVKLEFHIDGPWTTSWQAIVLLIAAFVLTILFFGYFYRKYLNEQNKKRVFYIENEIKGIRAQLNPHFIKNAFNILSMNIEESPEGFDHISYISQLSDYFNKVLVVMKKSSHSLEDELLFTEEYIRLQQRVSINSFDYRLSIEEGVDTFSIDVPTLLFQPFIENTIKHGFSAPNPSGIIDIKVYRSKKNLIILIKDNGIPAASERVKGQNSGLGISLTNRRLSLLYKTKKRNYILAGPNENEGGFFVRVEIPVG